MRKIKWVNLMKNKCGVYVLLVLLFLIAGSSHALAEKKDDVGFYVSPVTPATQLDLSRSFFYVKTEPENEQTIKVQVTNTTKEPKKIVIDIANAMTTEGGTIDYKKPLLEEKSLVNSVEEIVSTKDKEIELKANETKTVEFSIKPPKDHYEGIKMGTISFKNKSGEEANGMVSVYNAYKLDVILSENGDDFKNGSKLELINVTPTLNKGRKVVQTEIQNSESKIIRNLEFKTFLMNMDTGKTLKKIHTTDYALAPNSMMPFIFDMGLSNLKAGNYKVVMDISNVDNQWNLEKEFKITEDQAKKINDDSPFRINTPTWLKIVTVILGVVAMSNIYLLINRHKKWRKESKHRRNRKNKKRRGKKIK